MDPQIEQSEKFAALEAENKKLRVALNLVKVTLSTILPIIVQYGPDCLLREIDVAFADIREALK